MAHTIDKTNAAEVGIGYKHPPVKNQFPKGRSGNPRGRIKGQRNLPAVLSEILSQTVSVREGGKSKRMGKGEALIKLLMSMARNGDALALKAMLTLTEKIGRVENEELSSGVRRYGFMFVPGVAASGEEWLREVRADKERRRVIEQLVAPVQIVRTIPATYRSLPGRSTNPVLPETPASPPPTPAVTNSAPITQGIGATYRKLPPRRPANPVPAIASDNPPPAITSIKPQAAVSEANKQSVARHVAHPLTAAANPANVTRRPIVRKEVEPPDTS